MYKNNENYISKRAIPGVVLTPCDGYYKVRKIGLSAHRVKTDPKFKHTRTQAQTFGEIIHCINPVANHLLTGKKIKGARHRLISALLKAFKTGHPYDEAHSSEVPEAWRALIRLDLNAAAPWRETIKAASHMRFNSDAGELTYCLPELVPEEKVQMPHGITGMRLMMTVVTITDVYSVHCVPWQQSTLLPSKKIRVSDIKMDFRVKKMGKALHLVIAYIQWYEMEQVGGKMHKSNIAGPLNIINICV